MPDPRAAPRLSGDELRLDSTKSPKAIDLIGQDGPSRGKTQRGIYELSGDTLKVCLPLDETGARPTSFVTKVGLKVATITFKRTAEVRPTPPVAGLADRRRQNDLKQIGLAYHNYFSANNRAPSKVEDLAPFYESSVELTRSLKSGDIVFFYGVGLREMKAGTSNTVLAYEKAVPTTGGYALFGDGSVKMLTPAQFKSAVKAKR